MSDTIGERIMRLRQLKGLSQEELGEKLWVSRQAVSKWERGQTTPDIDKVILMSELFEVTTDYLLKGEELYNKSNSQEVEKTSDYTVEPKKSLSERMHFERKSKKTLFGLPLYHINLGLGLYRAKGVFSIGMISTGIFSIGLLSFGLFSLGLISIGLIAIGNISFGGFAIGGVAAGIAAIGGVALGVFSIGGLSIGMYSLGGCAIASQIACGGYAQGYIAIGETAVGEHIYTISGGMTVDMKNEIYNIIVKELPNTPLFIVNLFR